MPVQTAHAQRVRERPVVRAENADPVGGDPVWVGVVRSPPGWFERHVDGSHPALGLPSETRETLERRRRDLRMQGLCAEGAHNAAWEELDVDGRYRDHLSNAANGEVRDALDSLAAFVEAGRVVVATDRRPGFRCHRTVLSSVLEAGEPAATGSD
jgi:hypothetical protein